MTIKPYKAIKNNYNEIVEILKNTHEPVFLTNNGEGDLVVMDIETYNKREAALDLREQLTEVDEQRKRGVQDIPASEVSRRMRMAIKESVNV